MSPSAWRVAVTALLAGPAHLAAQAPTGWMNHALAALGVSVTVAEVTYPVPGRTVSEALAALDGGVARGALGADAHGLTEFDLVPGGIPVRWENGCALQGVRVEARLRLTLPRWTGADEALPHARHRWRAFAAAIRAHEEAHRDATVAEALRLATELRSLQAPTCPRLMLRMETLLRRSKRRLRRAHRAVDGRGR